MPLKRRLRILMLVPVVLLLVAIASSVIVSVFYADDLKQAIVGRLNKQLRAEIKVKDFGFSLWRHFPFVSFELNQVLVKDLLDTTRTDTLLQAERVSLLFDITGLIRDEVVVRKIVADDGVLHVRIDKQGRNNYEIWQSDTTGESKGIDLSKVRMNGMRLTFSEERSRQFYDFRADRLEFTGTFRESKFDLGVKGDLEVIRFVSEEVVYIEKKSSVIDASLAVDTEKGNYRLGDCSLKLGDVDFVVNGSFMVSEKTVFDLKINSGEAGLKEFISLLPAEYARKLKDFKTDGKFEFRSTLTGESTNDRSPVFKAAFSVQEGSLLPAGQDVALKDIRLSGVFESGPKGQLHISSLTAKLGSYPLKADLRITDMEQPFLDVHANSNIDLSSLKGFLRWDTLESLSGTARVDIAFSGRLKSFSKGMVAESGKIRSSGSVVLADVDFRLKENPLQFKSINAQLSLKDDIVQISRMTGSVSSTDFSVAGSIENLIRFLLVEEERSSFKAEFTSRNIDLDELLMNNSKTTVQDTSYKLRLNPRISGEMNVSIGHIKFRKFKADGLTGKVRLADQTLAGKDLRFKAMQGEVSMDAVINAARKDSVIMSCDAMMNKLDIKELFYELENFDQDVMTDRHVKGRVTADIQFRSSWTKDLTIDPSKARATCDITIENGELNDFKPILQLSKYLKVKDLRNIRFSTLHNVVSISNKLITIPTMEIKSTALDITASGTHDFDNMVDYKIRLYLSDVIGKKVKQQSTEFGEVEDDGLGRMQLFLSMKGPVDDPKITYDRKAVAEKLKTDIAREKTTIKQIFKEEFGRSRKDSLKKEPAKGKKEEMEIEW